MLTLGVHDWPRFFKHCWEHLEPGGWLETSETQFPGGRAEGEEDRPSPFIKWGDYVYEAAANAGIDARASEKFTEQLHAQGFVNVQKVPVHWPIRPWPKGRKYKVLGKLLHENTHKAVPAISMALFTKQLGWTKEQVDEYVEECKKDIDDRSNHFFFRM